MESFSFTHTQGDHTFVIQINYGNIYITDQKYSLRFMNQFSDVRSNNNKTIIPISKIIEFLYALSCNKLNSSVTLDFDFNPKNEQFSLITSIINIINDTEDKFIANFTKDWTNNACDIGKRISHRIAYSNDLFDKQSKEIEELKHAIEELKQRISKLTN